MKKEIKTTELINKEKPKKTTVRTTKQVFVQMGNIEIEMEKLKKEVESNFKKNYPKEKITDLKIYINSEEKNVYYVVNGRAEDNFKISLQ